MRGEPEQARKTSRVKSRVEKPTNTTQKYRNDGGAVEKCGTREGNATVLITATPVFPKNQYKAGYFCIFDFPIPRITESMDCEMSVMVDKQSATSANCNQVRLRDR